MQAHGVMLWMLNINLNLCYHFLVSAVESGYRPVGKVTKFISGDDLDDDFMTKDSAEHGTSDVKDTKIKTKKHQEPKVVNFQG